MPALSACQRAPILRQQSTVRTRAICHLPSALFPQPTLLLAVLSHQAPPPTTSRPPWTRSRSAWRPSASRPTRAVPAPRSTRPRSSSSRARRHRRSRRSRRSHTRTRSSRARSRSSKRKSSSSRTRPVQALRLAHRPRACSARSRSLRKRLRSLTGPFASSTRSSVRPTSSPATTNAKSRPSSSPGTSGSPSTRRWPRNTPTPRRSSRTLSRRSVTSDLLLAPLSSAVVDLFASGIYRLELAISSFFKPYRDEPATVRIYDVVETGRRQHHNPFFS